MEISLLDYQKECAEEALKIIENNYFYIDTSDMGRGKTSIVVYVSQKTNSNIYVIRSASITIWEKYAKKYGLSILGMTTYQSLAGNSSNRRPKSGLLKYIDDGEEYHHKPTKKLLNMIEEGVIFVFDESSSLKNESTYSSAVNTIARCIMKSESGKSRFIFLSGTLMTDPKNYFSIFRSLGYTDKKSLVIDRDGDGVVVIPNGIVDIIKECEEIDSEKTKKITKKYSISNQSLKIIGKLYDTIIDKNFIIQMPPGESIFGINAFYEITREKDRNKLRKAISDMGKISGYDDETMRTNGRINFGKLSKSMMNANISKAYDTARRGLHYLNQSTNTKLAIYCQNLDPLKKIEKIYEREGYKVLYVNGSSSPEERKKYVKKFQKDNNKYRIILFTDVLSFGVDLDDQTGNHPRVCLLFPSFYLDRILQTVKRFKRANTIGDPIIEMVYGNMGNKISIESRIIKSITTKSDFVKHLMKSKYRDRVVLPSDYEEWWENKE